MNHDSDPNAATSEARTDVGAEAVARVYAEALLAAADQAGQTQQVVEEIDSFLDDLYASRPNFEVILSGAALGRKARHGAIAKIFADRPDDVFGKFMQVLNEHERLELLRPIRQALHELLDERNHRVKVHVFTAVPLADEYWERIAAAVRHNFSLEPVLVPHVDPALLGGLKVRIGDKQLDATVRTRLDNIKNQVIARGSYEIQSRRDHFRTD
jgi:F-type H+-transporting ATPase subunit delta